MADVNKLRADVAELLALTESVHKPNNGTIAELCRTWLAVHDAGGLPELLAIAEASESLRADAMRYRWLRNSGECPIKGGGRWCEPSVKFSDIHEMDVREHGAAACIDAAIDAAMSELVPVVEWSL